MKIAAAYIRVSDERQTEYSPDSQLKLVRRYAEQHDYYIPDEYIFQDDGISAKSAAKRPAFNRMIAIAKEKEHSFDAILVWKFSRFARNQEESIVFKSLLAKNGISVISVSEPIVEGAFGSLIERIIEWFDAFYILNLATEVKRGMTEKASRGEPLCHPAFGYDMRDGKYYPNEHDAAIVRHVFESFVAGTGMRKIAREIADAGVRTKRGNRPDNRFIEYMLHNPVYIGKIRWSTDGKMASKRQFDSDTFMIVKGNHEPIVSRELFDNAQKRLAEIEEHHVPYRRIEQPTDFMLKGLVRCGDCGATLVLACKNTHPMLQCHNYSRGACPVSHAISIQKANHNLITYLQEVSEYTDLSLIPRVRQNSLRDPDSLQELLAKEKRKLQKVRDAYISGTDTLEEYTAAKATIQKNIDRLQKSIERQTASAAASADPRESEEFRASIKRVLTVITSNDSTEQSKNESVRSIISHINFHKPSGKFEVFFW